MAKSRAKKLTDVHRAFLVQRLACFDGPKEAAAALKEEYGIEVTPQACENYDPNKRAGAKLAQKWRDLFEHTRKAFLDDVTAHVPEANKAVRVRMLAHSARALRGRGNHVAAADMLERIAKELGNVHSNRREITGKEGGPIAFSEMTDEQIDARLTKLAAAIGMGASDDSAAG